VFVGSPISGCDHQGRMPKRIDLNSKKIDNVSESIDRRIETLRSSVRGYRRRFFVYQMSTVILSGSVTVLSGWKGLWLGPDAKSDIILLFSALSTVISAWSAFYSPRETWHLYTDTLGKLLGLRSRLAFQTCDLEDNSSNNNSAEKAFDEFQQILSDHNDHWQQLRKK
jgi:hypothetical protein